MVILWFSVDFSIPVNPISFSAKELSQESTTRFHLDGPWPQWWKERMFGDHFSCTEGDDQEDWTCNWIQSLWGDQNKKNHSYPKWEYKMKNVSRVWYIFLKSKLYDNSKNYFSKILGLGPCPLTTISFERSILEKMSESRPPFFNFRGGLLSIIFQKNHSKCLKTAIFPLKVCL